MPPDSSIIPLPRRRSRAFTLVEIMVVVVIIGLLAAAALPAYRLITLRSRAASVVNDLRTFSTVFITYSLQNGRYPDNGDPQVVPPQVVGQLPGNFTQRTPIGGVYRWNFDVPADGIPAKAALIIQAESGYPIMDDLDQLEAVDKQIDDGNLATGNLQLGSTNSLVFIIEK
ncbi:MAG TPA: prepilin-type N-terminal cleavage/methylation domain-containing protein [Lacunisphaera sp.]|jgi:prepilin-type N-terminal cleavage/methylation domain-containing protein|nr:prepilin-type N-terminal cleavage/methylation domain-containing protein [Lacunisphaera sp.]HQY05489.1 prepilin-type N-terminal cleavage/methylation domain-containing protein [Lacunisphaera sp.]